MKTSHQPRTTSRTDVVLHSWASIFRTYKLFNSVLSSKLAEIGLRPFEYKILTYVKNEPKINQQALATRCLTTKSYVSGLLNEMVNKGWISRENDPDDGRTKLLMLTDSGSQMADRAAEIQTAMLALISEDAPNAELLLITQTMNRSYKKLDLFTYNSKEKLATTSLKNKLVTY